MSCGQSSTFVDWRSWPARDPPTGCSRASAGAGRDALPGPGTGHSPGGGAFMGASWGDDSASVVPLVGPGLGEEHVTGVGPAGQGVVGELGAIVAVNAGDLTANGTCSTNESDAARMWAWALLRIAAVNTRPVCTSVKFTLRQDSPFREGPQWATVSTSKNPGSVSTSSPALRSVIEFRSGSPGSVAVFPRIGPRCFTGARYLSIVAAAIDSFAPTSPHRGQPTFPGETT